MDLGGKTAVVTGAASGIGLALATRFGAEGMNVVLADLDEAALARVGGELAATGAKVLGVPTDVSSAEQVTALAARAKAAFGDVHLLCNNAGVAGGGGPLWQLSERDWSWAVSVNLMGVVHGVRAFVPAMIEHGAEAHVVNTASIAGLGAPAFMGAYVATKHAVVALSEVLARDLQAMNTRLKVSVLCPGFVRTNIADSEQYRPEHLKNERDGEANPTLKMVDRAVRKLVEKGLAPDVVAEHVVAAVRQGRFYVLPHPELKGMVRERLADIMEDRYPRFDAEQFSPARNKS